jgi:hypothetical protein
MIITKRIQHSFVSMIIIYYTEWILPLNDLPISNTTLQLSFVHWSSWILINLWKLIKMLVHSPETPPNNLSWAQRSFSSDPGHNSLFHRGPSTFVCGFYTNSIYPCLYRKGQQTLWSVVYYTICLHEHWTKEAILLVRLITKSLTNKCILLICLIQAKPNYTTSGAWQQPA